jgi:hypothetical protein
MINTTTIPTHFDQDLSFLNIVTIISSGILWCLTISEFILYTLKDKNIIYGDDSDNSDGDNSDGDIIEKDYCSKYLDEFKALVSREMSEDELNSLHNKFVKEHVKDTVDIIMTFDKDAETFWYYTNHLKEVSYAILETVARKFVIDYDCKIIFLQSDVSTSSTSNTSIEQPPPIQAQPEVKSVFAKFKQYNTGGKGAAPNFTSKVKVFEQMNHFRYKGKLYEYEEKQKMDENKIKNSVDEPILDYAYYKNLLVKEKEKENEKEREN